MAKKINAIKRMSVQEFRDIGFLQEANRLFFHPLGLALEVIVKCKESPNIADSGEMLIGGIWDYRDDPEGMLFNEKDIDLDKVHNVQKLRQPKLEKRKKYNCDEKGIQQP